MHDLYTERAQCVIAVARAARALGCRVGFALDPVSGPGWPVLFVDLPTGQVSWHLTVADRDRALDIGPYPGTWDGHTTDEKYARLAAWKPEKRAFLVPILDEHVDADLPDPIV